MDIQNYIFSKLRLSSILDKNLSRLIGRIRQRVLLAPCRTRMNGHYELKSYIAKNKNRTTKYFVSIVSAKRKTVINKLFIKKIYNCVHTRIFFQP